MTTFIHRPDHPLASSNGMVDKRLIEEECIFGESSYVISDVMEPTRHMATGKIHDSKSEFRKDTKRSGCIEVGNDVGAFTKPRSNISLSRRERAEHIKQAIEFLRNK